MKMTKSCLVLFAALSMLTAAPARADCHWGWYCERPDNCGFVPYCDSPTDRPPPLQGLLTPRPGGGKVLPLPTPGHPGRKPLPGFHPIRPPPSTGTSPPPPSAKPDGRDSTAGAAQHKEPRPDAPK
jgi:hypothetical protein